MKHAKLLTVGALSVLATLASPLAASTDTFTIPAGTTLDVQLTSTLSTKTNQTGDLFTGKVTEPIFYQGEEVVPEGSAVQGHLTFVQPPGRVKGKAEMRLVLDAIKTPDGQNYSLAAQLQEVKGPTGVTVKGNEGTIQGPGKDTKGGAIETGVAAGVGAGVGAIADGGSGALYGAAIGAVVAVAHTLAKHHGEATLPPGTDMTCAVPRNVTATKAATGPMVVPNAN
jgi:hypothetical protein